MKTISNESYSNFWTEKGKKAGWEISHKGKNIMNLSGVSGAFIQIGFCWALMSQCLGGLLKESRKKLMSLLSVQEIRGVRSKVKSRGKCKWKSRFLEHVLLLFIFLAGLHLRQFSLWTNMSFILVLLSHTPLECEWYSYQLRSICSLLDNSYSVLSLSTSCFFQFSPIFSIVCILFSVNKRQ